MTADTHPDHDTICRVRRENFEAVSAAFLQVLQLARTMGVLKVGTVSVDGTHIKANASKNRNVRYDFRPESVTARPEKKITDPRMLAMKDKLATDEGKCIYAKRKHTVEPVFGIIKHVMGYRQTLLRGFEKVSGDWGLVCLAYNFKRPFSLQTA